jgi:hypothetical protein
MYCNGRRNFKVRCYLVQFWGDTLKHILRMVEYHNHIRSEISEWYFREPQMILRHELSYVKEQTDCFSTTHLWYKRGWNLEPNQRQRTLSAVIILDSLRLWIGGTTQGTTEVCISEESQVRTQDLSFCLLHFMGVHAAWSAVKQMKDLW